MFNYPVHPYSASQALIIPIRIKPKKVEAVTITRKLVYIVLAYKKTIRLIIVF